MKKILTGTLLAMVAASSVVSAAPSLNGSTGLINTPSAHVLREGQFSLGYYNLDDNNGVGVLNLNLAPNLEIGVAGFRYDGQEDKNQLNFKYGVMPETVLTPGLSIGIEDLSNETNKSAYAVASKGLPFGFRINAGVGNGRYNGLFAGIEKTISPLGFLTGNNVFPATTLIAEYDGKNMNYGARMSIIPGLKIDAGWRDDATYFGMSYTY